MQRIITLKESQECFECGDIQEAGTEVYKQIDGGQNMRCRYCEENRMEEKES